MWRPTLVLILLLPASALAQWGPLAPQGGTITGVTAGTGLTGGGLSGNVTVNVVCGTGLTCAADSISVNSSVIPSGSGTLNTMAKWTGSSTLGNSSVTDTGSLVTVANPLTVTGNTTLSTMTSGSILFAGTAGLVSQDNTHLFWDDANDALSVTTTTSSSAVRATNADSVAGAMSIRNTNVNGPVDFYALDSAGASKMSWGYGNTGYSDTARVGRGYVWRNTGVDFVFSRTNTVDGMIFSDGNFNIGSTTTNPTVKLRVEGDTTLSATNPNLFLNGSTSSLLRYSTNGIAAPTFTTRSAGTKIVLFPEVDATHSDYAIGVEGGYVWTSVSQNVAARGFRWYAGTTQIADLTATTGMTLAGTLSVNGNSTFGDDGADTTEFRLVLIRGNNTNAPSATRRAALELHTGRDSSHALLSGQTVGDVAIQYGGGSGGFRHWISSKHSTTASTANALRFWVNTGSSAETSTLPGTGNTNVLDLYGDTSARFYGALQADGSVTLGDAFADTLSIVGTAAITSNPTGSVASSVMWNASRGGTFDTTSGVITNTGLTVGVSSTRSAGSNNLNNRGLTIDVSGGQTNTAMLIDRGDVTVNVTSGSTTFQRSVTLNNTAGTTTVVGAATMQSTAAINGNATIGDANADLMTVFGHALYDGTAPSKNAACDGAGAATVTGTDSAFHSTLGAGATACTWTFSRTFTVAPTCTAFPEGGAALPTCTISATAITCTVAAGGTTYHWNCATSNGGT